MNGKLAYVSFAIFSIYESSSEVFIDPVMKITQSSVILFNASSTLFTNVRIKLEALILITGEEEYDSENY